MLRTPTSDKILLTISSASSFEPQREGKFGEFIVGEKRNLYTTGKSVKACGITLYAIGHPRDISGIYIYTSYSCESCGTEIKWQAEYTLGS